jgi:hypothetical protein
VRSLHVQLKPVVAGLSVHQNMGSCQREQVGDCRFSIADLRYAMLDNDLALTAYRLLLGSDPLNHSLSIRISPWQYCKNIKHFIFFIGSKKNSPISHPQAIVIPELPY